MPSLLSTLSGTVPPGRYADIPRWCLFLVFILFPVAHLRVFGTGLYWSEAALLFAVAAAPLMGWGWLRTRFVVIVLERQALVLWAALFLVGILSAFFLNPHTLSGWGAIKSFYILPVVFSALILVFGETKEWLERFTLAWLLGLLAASVAALSAFSAGWQLYDGRLAGPYLSPNYLAMLVAPGVLLSLYFFQSRTERTAQWLSILGLIFILPVLWATHSYAAWLALCVAVVVFVGIGRLSVRPALLTLLLAVLVVGGFFVQESGSEKFQAILSGSERSSLASRIMIWRSAGQIAADSFPWGIGTGRFQETYLAYQSYFPPYLEWAVPTPHNLYLHFLIEGGVLALIGWLGCVSVIALAALKPQSWSQGSGSIPAVGALGVALLSFYLVYGLVDTPYMKNDLALAVWGTLGLTVAAFRIRA